LRDALAPYATGRVYANFIAADEADRVPSAHGPENYRRLRQLKSKYDPANVFSFAASPDPAAAGSALRAHFSRA
jgi:FAD/FMN-containing dehydrogenase